MRPLDAEARQIIAKAAKRVSVVTAVNPAPALDVLFTGYQVLAMLRQVAGLYGGRPGSLETLKLARMHLLGKSGPTARAGWNVTDSDKDTALEPMLAQALEAGTLDTFFALLRPNHAEYSSLRAAYNGPDLDAEQVYLTALQQMTQVEVLGNTLILRNEAGVEMVFGAR